MQKARGDLYRKGDHTYIRYEEEPNELGRTVTLIKLEDNQIRIVRQGDVQAEQTFRPWREADWLLSDTARYDWNSKSRHIS